MFCSMSQISGKDFKKGGSKAVAFLMSYEGRLGMDIIHA